MGEGDERGPRIEIGPVGVGDRGADRSIHINDAIFADLSIRVRGDRGVASFDDGGTPKKWRSFSKCTIDYTRDG